MDPRVRTRLHLTPHLFPSYSLLMIEYGFFTYEDDPYEKRVHHIQLAYAPYAALLAASEVTSILGVGGTDL